MKFYKIIKILFSVEIIALAAMIIGGLYDHSFWFFGLFYLLPTALIVSTLLLVGMRMYVADLQTAKSLRKMLIVNIFLLATSLILWVDLARNPINIPID